MIRRIHILGASGSGTTTLGRALAERLQYPHEGDVLYGTTHQSDYLGSH